MKKVILVILAMSLPLFAQTTITTVTTVQDGCGGKALYCTLAVTDENGGAGQITLDNRVTATGPLGNLSVSALEFSGSAHGTYSGITGNPDGTKNAFDGIATYSGTGYSPDGTPFSANGTFNYHAVFVFTCQGRGCPTYGWHYTVKAGSTVTISQ
jgi:hypothetical protein